MVRIPICNIKQHNNLFCTAENIRMPYIFNLQIVVPALMWKNKVMHMGNNSQGFKQCIVGIKWPNVCFKIFLKLLNHHHQPEQLTQGRMDPCPKFWPYHLHSTNQDLPDQTFSQSCALQFLWLHAYCSLSVLLLADQVEPASCRLLAHPIQDLMLCMFRDDLLHGTVVTCDYFTYHCVSVSLNSLPILLWPLSLASRFRPQNCSTVFFFFFSHHNSRDGCVRKSQEISSFSDTQISLSGTYSTVIPLPPFGCLVWTKPKPLSPKAGMQYTKVRHVQR